MLHGLRESINSETNNNVRYADDSAAVAYKPKTLQCLLNRLTVVGYQYGVKSIQQIQKTDYLKNC